MITEEINFAIENAWEKWGNPEKYAKPLGKILGALIELMPGHKSEILNAADYPILETVGEHENVTPGFNLVPDQKKLARGKFAAVGVIFVSPNEIQLPENAAMMQENYQASLILPQVLQAVTTQIYSVIEENQSGLIYKRGVETRLMPYEVKDDDVIFGEEQAVLYGLEAAFERNLARKVLRQIWKDYERESGFEAEFNNLKKQYEQNYAETHGFSLEDSKISPKKQQALDRYRAEQMPADMAKDVENLREEYYLESIDEIIKPTIGSRLVGKLLNNKQQLESAFLKAVFGELGDIKKFLTEFERPFKKMFNKQAKEISPILANFDIISETPLETTAPIAQLAAEGLESALYQRLERMPRKL